MPNMKSTAQAGAMRVQAAEDLADHHLAHLFDTPVINQGSTSLDRQVATGEFSPIIAMLKGPMQGLEQREGLLIQGAVTLAMKTIPGLILLPTLRVTVTDSDRKLVEGNRHADLSQLAPPHAGDETGRVEVDLAVANPNANSLLLLDIKRFPRDKDKDISRLKEACLPANFAVSAARGFIADRRRSSLFDGMASPLPLSARPWRLPRTSITFFKRPCAKRSRRHCAGTRLAPPKGCPSFGPASRRR